MDRATNSIKYVSKGVLRILPGVQHADVGTLKYYCSMNVSKGSLRIPPGVQHADVKIDAIIIDSSRKSGYMFQSDLNNTPSANMGNCFS